MTFLVANRWRVAGSTNSAKFVPLSGGCEKSPARSSSVGTTVWTVEPILRGRNSCEKKKTNLLRSRLKLVNGSSTGPPTKYPGLLKRYFGRGMAAPGLRLFAHSLALNHSLRRK